MEEGLSFQTFLKQNQETATQTAVLVEQLLNLIQVDETYVFELKLASSQVINSIINLNE